MKQIVTNQTVKIPKEVTVSVKSRLVTVKGPRGVLKRNFKHLALDIHVCLIQEISSSPYNVFHPFLQDLLSFVLKFVEKLGFSVCNVDLVCDTVLEIF